MNNSRSEELLSMSSFTISGFIWVLLSSICSHTCDFYLLWFFSFLFSEPRWHHFSRKFAASSSFGEYTHWSSEVCSKLFKITQLSWLFITCRSFRHVNKLLQDVQPAMVISGSKGEGDRGRTPLPGTPSPPDRLWFSMIRTGGGLVGIASLC